jgi:hypothetical protein
MRHAFTALLPYLSALESVTNVLCSWSAVLHETTSQIRRGVTPVNMYMQTAIHIVIQGTNVNLTVFKIALNFIVSEILPFSIQLIKSVCLLHISVFVLHDRLCDLVIRVPGYRSRGPGSITGATEFSEKQWV